MKTAYKIIVDAFGKLGQLGETETINTYQIEKGRSALESMTKAWATHDLPNWNLTVESIPFSVFGSNDSITFHPNATLAPTRIALNLPVKLISAWRQKDNVRTELNVVARKEHFTNAVQDTESVPHDIYMTPATLQTPAVIYIHPRLSSDWLTGELILDYQYLPSSEYTTPATAIPDYPEHMEEALIYNLAVRLAPDYGLSVQERATLKQEAEMALKLALEHSQDLGSVFFRPAKH